MIVRTMSCGELGTVDGGPQFAKKHQVGSPRVPPLPLSHPWNLSPTQAVTLQRKLRHQVRIEPYAGKPTLIGGSDVSFNKYEPTVYAGFVVLDARTLGIVDRACAAIEVSFPYIPGLLSFREVPALLEAWKALRTKPDVLVFDGQGIAHPRRLGIASHAGLLLDWPSIGCAKSLLTGIYDEPGAMAGASSPLLDRFTHEQIGVVYRTKNNVKPVFISPGHRMDMESAVRILAATVRGYRIPEPTRQAHLYVNEVRRARMAKKD